LLVVDLLEIGKCSMCRPYKYHFGIRPAKDKISDFEFGAMRNQVQTLGTKLGRKLYYHTYCYQ